MGRKNDDNTINVANDYYAEKTAEAGMQEVEDYANEGE